MKIKTKQHHVLYVLYLLRWWITSSDPDVKANRTFEIVADEWKSPKMTRKKNCVYVIMDA